MVKFAYLDNGDILHITDDKETAKRYSRSGVCIETEHKAAHGRPIVAVNGVDKEVTMYSLEKAVYTTDATRKTADGVKIDLACYPKLVELYKACM